MASNKAIATIGASGFLAAAAIIGEPATLHYEGMRLKPYYDSVGVKTWCAGETLVGYKGSFTVNECLSLYSLRYGWYSKNTAILYNATGAKYITPPMHAAFTDMSYNVGVGTVAKSTMIRKINSGDPKGACDGILLYKKAGGMDCSKTKGNPMGCYGVWKRRVKMHELCISGLA